MHSLFSSRHPHHLQCDWICPWVKRVLPGSPQTHSTQLVCQNPAASRSVPQCRAGAARMSWCASAGQRAGAVRLGPAAAPAAFAPLLSEPSQTEGLLNSFKITTHSMSRFIPSWSLVRVHPIPKPLLTPAGLPRAETHGAGGGIWVRNVGRSCCLPAVGCVCVVGC